MGEIKFRVWCKNKGEWEKDPTVIGMNGKLLDVLHHQPMNRETHIIQQHTGMTDKNRNGIYEGDIVKDTDNGKIFEVFWNDIGCGTWWFTTRDKEGLRCHARRIDLDDLEVIGNIYENFTGDSNE